MINKLIYTVPKLWRWIVFAGYINVIAFASLTPPRNIPKFIYFPNIDKVVHFVMYLGFCILAAWSCDNRRYLFRENHYSGKSRLWIYPLVLFLAISWGLLMEIFQRLMAIGRHYSMLDLLANILGALIGVILYYLTSGRNRDL